MTSDYDRTVSQLYQAALGTSPWQAPLDGMAALLDAWNVHLMGIDHQSGIMQFSHEGGNPPAEGTLDYIQTWHRADPRSALVMRNAPAVWTHCHEHFDEDFVQSDPFYRDFLIPYGMRYISGVKFPPIGTLTCIFSASRGVGRAPFDPGERELLARFGEHVYAALQMRASATAAARQAMAGVAVLERIGFPLMLLDAQRAILFQNAAARELLSTHPALKEVAGALRITRSTLDAQLTHRLKSLELAGQAKTAPNGAPSRHVLVLDVSETDSLVLHLATMAPGDVMGAFGNQSLTLATAFAIRANHRVDPYVLQMVHDMTPAEARVASAVASGQRAERIADSLAVSIATIRTQLGRAMEKAGVSGQVELASMLAGNPLYWGGLARS